MQLLRTERFRRDYAKLPKTVQKQAERKLRYLAGNMGHPSLRVKRVRKSSDLYEGSINMNYRFIFLITPETYVLMRIGDHDIIDSS